MEPSKQDQDNSNFPLTELPALNTGINDSQEEDNYVSVENGDKHVVPDEQLHAKKRTSSYTKKSALEVPAETSSVEQSNNAMQDKEARSQTVKIVEDKPFLSTNMIKMSQILNQHKEEHDQRVLTQNAQKFQQLSYQVIEKDEVLMALYLCVTRFMSQSVFTQLLVKNGSFKDLQPNWYLLFTEQNIFTKLSNQSSSVQRSQFNLIVLKQALERDYQFIIEDIMDGRSFVTNTMVEILWLDGQIRTLANLIAVPKRSKATRPRFLHLDRKKKSTEIRQALGGGGAGVHIQPGEQYIDINMSYPEMSTQEVVQIGLDMHIKTGEIIEFLTILRNEIKANDIPDAQKQLCYPELFKQFVKARKIKLLRFLFSHKIDFQFTSEIFIQVLEEDAYDVASLLHRQFRYIMKKNQTKENKVIVSLIAMAFNKTTNNGAGMIDQKCYLVREYLDLFQLRNARHLLDFIDKKVNIPNKLNLLVSNFNVVLTGCLLTEVLYLVSQKFDQLKVRCDTIKLKIVQHVAKYMHRVTRQDEMKYLLLEKDFEDRDALDFITKYEIYEFLKSQFAENVVKEIWRSPYATSDSLSGASTNFFLLFNYYHCEQDVEKQMRFFNGKQKRKIENNSLQFTVWRYSGKSRIIVEFFTTVVLCVYVHVLIRRSFTLHWPVWERMKLITAIENQYRASVQAGGQLESQEAIYNELKDIQAQAQDDFLAFFNVMMELTWASFLSLMWGFQYISDIAYSSVTKRNYNPGKWKGFVDLTIFLMFFTFILVTFATNLRDTISEGIDVVTWNQKAYKYCRNYSENTVSERTLLAVADIIIWFKVIQYFKYNDYLGRYFGIVKRLVSEITLFFVIYLVNLLFFAVLADSSFREIKAFNSITNAFGTLFYASFGEFDFEEIGEAKISPRFGLSFMIIFLIINLGLFMSLFISIITVLYAIFHKNDRVYQMIETLEIRSTSEADKKYSLLVSVPAPFNFFLFFAAPFLMTSKNPEQCNQKLLLIFYSPILLVAIVLFLILEVFMWPLTYTKMVFHKLTMVWVYSRNFRSSRADKFMNFVYFFFCGPFIVIGNTFIDLYFFVMHMIRFDLQKIKNKTKFTQLSKDNLQMIQKELEPNQEKIMHFKDITFNMRSKMNVIELIQTALFPVIDKNFSSPQRRLTLNPKVDNVPQLNKDFHMVGVADMMADHKHHMILKIAEFKVFKQILDKNSQMLGLSLESLKSNDVMNEVHYDLQSRSYKIVDCKLFHVVMQDLKRQRMVAKVKQDDHIFVKLSQNPFSKAPKKVKTSSQIQRNRMDNLKLGDQVAFGQNAEDNELGINLQYAQSSEISRQIEKRDRNLFKKLYYLNTSRILQIVGYVPTQVDERKFLFSNYKQYISQKREEIPKQIDGAPQVNLLKQHTQKSAVSIQQAGQSTKFMDELQNQVLDLTGATVPRLQNSIVHFKNELQTMIERLRPMLQNMPSESAGMDRYSEFKGKLHPSKYQVENNHF